jgi:hypothetical protein
MAIDICCSTSMMFFIISGIQRIWTILLPLFLIEFRHTRKTAIENLHSGKLHASSPVLNSPKYHVGANGTVQLYVVNVSSLQPSVHCIAICMDVIAVQIAQISVAVSLQLEHSI